MISYPTILQAVLPVFLIMAVGFLTRRTGFLSGAGDEALMKLTVNLFFPALILDNILGDPLLREGGTVFSAVFLGFAIVVFGIALCYLAAPVLGLEKGKGRRTFALATGIQNYGFMAIPVLVTLFPESGSLGLLFAHSLGVEIAVWTVGLTILTGTIGEPWKVLANGPLLAIIVGLTLNYTGGDKAIPAVAATALESLGACSIPVALLLVGASIADLMKAKRIARASTIYFGACTLRLVILPVPFLVAAIYFNLVPELRQVLIVQAAMPGALFPIVLAKHYGGHPATAVQVAIATTLASLVTMPIIITIGMRLVFPAAQ
ncbi:MAG: AEC family transporter [Verrucomicrobiales bacterium]